MESTGTTLYRTDSATFELPNKLKDKSVHMFTLSDNGPSEFSIVITHADLQDAENLEEFGERLVAEMKRSLPQFELYEMVERSVDGSPAIELGYGWRNNSQFMHQRQVIAIVEGRSDAGRRAVLVAATCLKPFTDEWTAAFDATIASMRLRKSSDANDLEALSSDTAASDAESWIFVLSERRRTLRVFADRQEACANTDAREVERDAWAFFDETGQLLHPRFLVENSGKLWRKAGTYVLESLSELTGEPLQARLHRVAILQPGASAAHFATIDDVRRFLNQSHAG